MSRREVLKLIFVATLLVWIVATPLLASRPGEGMNYTSKENIEYAQSILAGEGYLERGDYAVGSRDRATQRAIEDFQRRHRLNGSGRLDFDTMAMLSSHEPATVAMAQLAPVPPPPAPEPQAATAPPPPPPSPEPPPPAPVVVAAVDDEPEMPATAGPLPLLALAGSLLAGLGLLIMLRRPV